MSTAVLEAPEAEGISLVETPEPTKPDTRAAALAECEARLVNQVRIFREAESTWSAAHREAGELKKEMEAEQNLLNKLADEMREISQGNYTPRLPFPADDAPAHDAVDAWRLVPLVDLDMPASVAAMLEDARLPTLGALADYTRAGKLLTDIKGIGQAKADQIEDATAAYWAANPMPSESDDCPKAVKESAESPIVDPGATQGPAMADAVCPVDVSQVIPIPFSSKKTKGTLTVQSVAGEWEARFAIDLGKGGGEFFSVTFKGGPGYTGRASAIRQALREAERSLRSKDRITAADDVAAWRAKSMHSLVIGTAFEQEALREAMRIGIEHFNEGRELKDFPETIAGEELQAWNVGWHEAREIMRASTPSPEGDA